MQKNTNRGSLGVEVAKNQVLKERLKACFPGLDEETLTDTLDGMSDLKELLAAIIRSALVDAALAKGLQGRIETMRERLESFQVRAEKKRELALSGMTEVGLNTLRESDFTASVRPCPRHLVVTAEDKIPPRFWIPQAPRLDRQGILLQLKCNKEVPGAALSNPAPTLAVRTK